MRNVLILMLLLLLVSCTPTGNDIKVVEKEVTKKEENFTKVEDVTEQLDINHLESTEELLELDGIAYKEHIENRVTNNRVRIRKGPATSYDSLALDYQDHTLEYLLTGTKVSVIAMTTDVYEIGNHTEGLHLL